MKRIVVALGGIALMAALVAEPVAAQADIERERFTTTFEFVGDNPCNGQPIVYTGEGQGFTQVVTTPSGETVTKIHVVSSGEAVDELGNTYKWRGTSNDEIHGAGAPVTSTGTFRAINQGSADNFVFNLQFHLSPNGQVHVNLAGSECRG
jgi:hypothetical protein